MQTLGLQANHPVLDPQVVKQCFQQTCEFFLAEAEAMAQNWRNLPVYQIRQLRQLKNRLWMMVQLRHIPQVRSCYPDLEPWLNLQLQLP